jgi:hypothetical protein
LLLVDVIDAIVIGTVALPAYLLLNVFLAFAYKHLCPPTLPFLQLVTGVSNFFGTAGKKMPAAVAAATGAVIHSLTVMSIVEDLPFLEFVE